MNAWQDFFSDLDPPGEDSTFGNESYYNDNKLTSNAQSVYIYNCFFKGLVSPEDGGAVLYSVNGGYILVEKSTFEQCATTANYTAAIRVDAGNSIISHICGYNCTSAQNDGFYSCCDQDNERRINSVFETSACHCEAGTRYTIFNYWGFIEVKSLNLSFNQAPYYSGLTTKAKLLNEAGDETDVRFSSFANNIATIDLCIYLANNWNKAGSHKVSFCNIIYNRGSNLFQLDGTTTVTDSCIMMNEGNYFLISSNDPTTLINCSIDKVPSSSDSIITKISTQSFILGLSFIKTGHCKNKFDVIGSLTPSNMTPEKIQSFHPQEDPFENTFDMLYVLKLFSMIAFLPENP